MTNPFQPPQADGILLGTRTVDYEVEISRNDLRCRRSLPARVFLLVVLCFSAFVGFGLCLRIVRLSGTDLLLSFTGLVFVASISWLVYRFLGPGIANARIAYSPKLLGLQRGTLGNDWVTRENSGGSVRYRSEHCTHASVRGDVLELAFDRYGLSLQTIPARCISRDDFLALSKLFRGFALESRQYRTTLGDRRNVEQDCIDCGPLPDAAIAYSGTLLTTDTGHLGAQVGRAKRKILLLASGFAIFAIAAGLASGTLILTGTIAVAVILILLRRLRLIQKLNSKSGVPIMKMCGAISDTHLTASSPSSLSHSPLSNLVFVSAGEDVLALKLEGSSGAMILLPKRFFASEGEWQTATEFAQKACQPAN